MVPGSPILLRALSRFLGLLDLVLPSLALELLRCCGRERGSRIHRKRRA